MSLSHSFPKKGLEGKNARNCGTVFGSCCLLYICMSGVRKRVCVCTVHINSIAIGLFRGDRERGAVGDSGPDRGEMLEARSFVVRRHPYTLGSWNRTKYFRCFILE